MVCARIWLISSSKWPHSRACRFFHEQFAKVDHSRAFDMTGASARNSRRGITIADHLKSLCIMVLAIVVSGHHPIALYLGAYRSNMADSWLKMTAITRLSIFRGFVHDGHCRYRCYQHRLPWYEIWQENKKTTGHTSRVVFDTYGSDQPANNSSVEYCKH